MEPYPSFVFEIANLLHALPEVSATFFGVNMPFSYFFLSEKRLVIQCVPVHFDAIVHMPETFAAISDRCAEKDIKVIHLWEDVWRTKKNVVTSRLRALLGQTYRIPARLTQVRRIDKPTLDWFLSINHLQGSTTAKYKYGLFLPQRYFRVLEKWQHKPELSLSASELLVAVASFSGGKNILRAEKTYRSFELIRFANVLDATVVGGLNKLLSAFIKEVQPDDIMTYADRDWSTGQSYERLGFERIGITPPQEFWVNPATFERKYASPKNLPESTLKIYNAGNIKYLLNLLKNPK
ncbi:hypothetical protein [Runella sp.]|uniref:hypothetical protein n=1 Tax=Runella sp. TaxID=1960881 RepID=UPI003D108372